jgi:hypothetical protein
MVSSHVVIAGTGRAGTTLLVQLLGNLGYDTGLGRLTYYAQAHAGLESSLLDADAPHVVKDPGLDLLSLLDEGTVTPESIEWLVIPVRDLDQAVLSRKHRSLAERKLDAAGGLVGTHKPWKQREELAMRVHELLRAAAVYELRCILVAFPRFAQDADYAYRVLAPLLPPDCSDVAFRAAWDEAVDRTLVRLEELRPSPWMELRLNGMWLGQAGRRRLRPRTRLRALLARIR